jgi:NifU-like protein involved in Fe-S cluster formation
MLKADGPPPGGRWADLAVLEPVRDYKARHASTLLVFDAVETALAEVESRRAEGRAAEGRTGQELEPAGAERCDTR